MAAHMMKMRMGTTAEVDNKEQIMKQLQDIQNEGLEQRNQDMDSYEAYKDGYSFYDGQTW